MAEIPPDARDLLTAESFATYGTLHADGRPHLTPVWIDYDSDVDQLLVNTAVGRQKDLNVQNDPRVAVMVLDPDDPYRYLSVDGHAARTTEGATEHIDHLARQYMGVETYPHHDAEDSPRVLHRITPEHVI